MGDRFQTVADVQASREQAPALAAAALAWLSEAGIVVGEATDCVLGGLGHAPGPNYASAVIDPDPRLLTLRTNGVRLDTGRTVFHSTGADQVTCPHCRHTIALTDGEGSPNNAWQDLSETIWVWYDGGGGERACPKCAHPVGLNDWSWSPPWGFGYLGITFWNWPPLRPQFLTELGTLLGHRTVCPYGKS